MNSFSEYLKNYKKQKGLTVAQFAKLLNVPKRTFEHWLYGDWEPKPIAIHYIKSKLEGLI